MSDLADRVELAMEALRLADDRLHADSGGRYGITDSNVMTVIEDYTTGTCPGICAGGVCCDYQRLSALVWAATEAEYVTPKE